MNIRTRIISILTSVASAATPAAAQMSLVSQSRSITVSGFSCGTQSASAPDFGPFVQSVTNAGGATVTQNSTLSATVIQGSGRTGYPGGFCSGISGTSDLSVTFSVSQPTSFTFDFSIVSSSFYPISISLVGPGVNVAHNNNNGQPTMPQVVAGVFQPGQYTLSATAHASYDHGTLQPGGWDINLAVGAAFWTIDCGGGRSTGGAYALTGTIGQYDASTESLTFDLSTIKLGFWPSGARYPCVGDYTRDGQVSLDDLFGFLNAYFVAHPSADVNGIDGVTVQDVFDFLVGWFRGGC